MKFIVVVSVALCVVLSVCAPVEKIKAKRDVDEALKTGIEAVVHRLEPVKTYVYTATGEFVTKLEKRYHVEVRLETQNDRLKRQESREAEDRARAEADQRRRERCRNRRPPQQQQVTPAPRMNCLPPPGPPPCQQLAPPPCYSQQPQAPTPYRNSGGGCLPSPRGYENQQPTQQQRGGCTYSYPPQQQQQQPRSPCEIQQSPPPPSQNNGGCLPGPHYPPTLPPPAVDYRRSGGCRQRQPLPPPQPQPQPQPQPSQNRNNEFRATSVECAGGLGPSPCQPQPQTADDPCVGKVNIVSVDASGNVEHYLYESSSKNRLVGEAATKAAEEAKAAAARAQENIGDAFSDNRENVADLRDHHSVGESAHNGAEMIADGANENGAIKDGEERDGALLKFSARVTDSVTNDEDKTIYEDVKDGSRWSATKIDERFEAADGTGTAAGNGSNTDVEAVTDEASWAVNKTKEAGRAIAALGDTVKAAAADGANAVGEAGETIIDKANAAGETLYEGAKTAGEAIGDGLSWTAEKAREAGKAVVVGAGTVGEAGKRLLNEGNIID